MAQLLTAAVDEVISGQFHARAGEIFAKDGKSCLEILYFPAKDPSSEDTESIYSKKTFPAEDKSTTQYDGDSFSAVISRQKITSARELLLSTKAYNLMTDQ
jgi:hypothetical protein